jgi:hypothetical protein
MKLFDHNNPRHIEILREELQRAKRILFENDRQQFMQANMYMRGTFSIIFRDSEYKNTNKMQDYVAGVVNSTSTDKDDILNALKQYAKENPEKMQDLNRDVAEMAEPINPTKSTGTSSLTPDAYKSYGPYKGD